MTAKEIKDHINQMLDTANRRQLDLIYRVVKDILK